MNQQKLMIFALGVILLVLGIILAIQTRTEMIYTTIYGLEVPTGRTQIVYPYLVYGVALSVIGVVCVIAGLANENRKENIQTAQS